MHFIIIFFWRKCVIFFGREKSNKVEKEKIEMAVVYHKYIVHNYFTVYLWIFVWNIWYLMIEFSFVN